MLVIVLECSCRFFRVGKETFKMIKLDVRHRVHVCFLALAMMACAACANAMTVRGRILGLGSWQTSNYVQSVFIQTDNNEWYAGHTQYLEGPGLVWSVDVPRASHSYTVFVFLVPSMRDHVYWMSATSYGSWTWWGSYGGGDVRFYLKS